MASFFKTATVNASDVAATLSNYPTYIDLSRIGVTTLAEAQSARIYLDASKTTEVAREIVSTQECHALIPSLTSTTQIWVDVDGIRADYAVTDTFGRNAVWSDYLAVWHLEEDPSGTAPQMIDSTGNGHDGTSEGSMTSGDLVSAKLGNGLSFDASDDQIEADQTFNGVGNFSASVWFKTGATGSFRDLINQRDNTSGTQNNGLWLLRTTSGNNIQALFRDTGATYTLTVDSSSTYTNDVFHLAYIQRSGTTGFIDINGGSDRQSIAGINNDIANSNNVTKIGRSTSPFDGEMDEARVIDVFLSSDWITTEYNNQSDEATFWGTWTDAGGGATFIPKILSS